MAGDNEKWDQLQKMRKANGDPNAAKAAVAPDDGLDRKRNADGTFAKTEEAPPVTTTPSADPPPVAAATPPATPPPVADPPPTGVEIELDGQKVVVAPEIAAAFTEAEKVKTITAAETERAKLKAEIREELKSEFAPVKSAAEIAADEALAAAEKAKTLPKKPDPQLLISDPAAWQAQQDLYEEARVNAAIEKSAADTRAKMLADATKQQQQSAQQQEAHARGVLREQFFTAYPVFKGSEAVVDALLTSKFDEVIASGRLSKPLTPGEAEALKKTEFADVATRATREIVKIMNGGKKLAPPPPPPTLAATAPQKTPVPAAPEPEAPRNPAEKYPKGSVSAQLARMKAQRTGASA